MKLGHSSPEIYNTNSQILLDIHSPKQMTGYIARLVLGS